jgi:hypothetical protein
MTTSQIRDRLAKAEERKIKKLSSIEKKKVLINKKTSQVHKAGYELTPEDKRRAYQNDSELGWVMSQIEFLEDDIVRLNKEIPEIDNLIEKYNTMLANGEKEDALFENFPEIFKQLEKDLFERWYAYDIKRKEYLREELKKMSYVEFIKMYKHSGYNLAVYTTEDQIKSDNKKAAHIFVLDLWKRINAITGEITDYSNIRLVGPALNGIVVGKAGKAKIETIIAGGYNIQREHYRVLVHSI